MPVSVKRRPRVDRRGAAGKLWFMRRSTIVVLLLACASALASFDRPAQGPAAPASAPATAPAPELSVSAVDGLEMTHALHRDVDVLSFLKTQPSGSVDYLDIGDSQPGVIVVVDVKRTDADGAAPVAPLPRAFETIFRGDGDGQLTRKWKPTEQNASGKYRAIFVVPGSIKQAETRVADAP